MAMAAATNSGLATKRRDRARNALGSGLVLRFSLRGERRQAKPGAMARRTDMGYDGETEHGKRPSAGKQWQS